MNVLENELKKTIQKLEESELLYRTIIDTTNTGFLITDDKGKVLDANSEYVRISGHQSLKEILGRSVIEWTADYQKEENIQKLKKCAEQGFVRNLCIDYIDKDGKITPTEINATFLETKDGLRIIGLCRDITERKILETTIDSERDLIQILLENHPDFIYFKDSKGRFQHMSKCFCEFFGCSKEDIIGKTDLELFPEEVAKQTHKEDLHIINTGIPLINKEESAKGVWVLTTKIPWFNKEGKKKGLFGISRDITERKKAGEKLKESEEKYKNLSNELEQKVEERTKELKESEKKYRGLIKAMPIGISISDPEGNISEVNSQMLKMFGYDSKEEFLKIPALDFYYNPKDREIFLELHQKDMVKEFEIQFYRKDGSIFWGSLTSIAQKTDERTIFINIIQDISERKKAELKLKESEEKYRSLFDNCPISLWEEDWSEIKVYIDHLKNSGINNFRKYFESHPNEVRNCLSMTKLIDINNGTLKMFKAHDKNEFIEKLQKIFIENTYNTFREGLIAFSKGKTIFESENTNKTLKGDIIFTAIKVIVAPGYEESLKRIIVSIIDISERKKAAQKLKNLNKLKTELMRRTSHELKTPLVSIKGYSDLLLDVHYDKFDDETISIIKDIKKGSERLEDLIDDILKSSKLDSDQIKLNPLKEDLAFLIRFCVKELKMLLKMRDQTISLNIYDKLIVKCEKERIYDVINNLLTNAIKYSHPKSEIVVQSEIKDDFIVISVKDNGIGFTEEEKKIIFQQFGKIEHYGKGWDIETSGSGLGLYIAKKIVELHGGKIWMESEGRNKGSTFYFSLPIIEK